MVTLEGPAPVPCDRAGQQKRNGQSRRYLERVKRFSISGLISGLENAVGTSSVGMPFVIERPT